MAIDLFDHQKRAVEQLKSGSILCGGVGSGKSRAAITYYFMKECEGKLKINGEGDFKEMKKPKDLYIITTAKKRDTLDWERECASFILFANPDFSISGVKVIVDSWNNIKKYVVVKNAFFIFDEQRLIGSGVWVKAFLKIVKENHWVLLTATPGDVWADYIPVFIANGFYKNRTEFLRQHAVYSRALRYPKIEKYIERSKLVQQRDKITVRMEYQKPTIAHDKIISVEYDKELFDMVLRKRWNVFLNMPVVNISELCFLMRKVVNSDASRIKAIKDLYKTHQKMIIFYNFDYELEILRGLSTILKAPIPEWNGHKHQEIPNTDTWLYLVQYSAGAEGWNCISTDTIVFYSQNYSYRMTVQAAGRIDRVNTPFVHLYYYYLRSNAIIDIAIAKALKRKKDFNIYYFMDLQ